MEKRKLKEEVINIKGMHCQSCVERIEEKLSQLKGVDKIRVSLVEEKAYVRFDSAQININKIISEIEDIGYRTDANSTEKSPTKEKSSIRQGIIYGLIPHTGCIAFIIASVLGVTAATSFFKPLLLNPYFFYILIAISFAFATISAIVYLKRQGFVSFNKGKDGLEISFPSNFMKRKWKYISTLYGTTIGINLLLFMVIFPLLANVSVSALPTIGSAVAVTGNGNNDGLSLLKLQVDIPCSGHAPLISGELKTVNGVAGIQFDFPNIFNVKFDPVKTSKEKILSLEIFKTYKATVLSESTNQQNTQQLSGQSGNSVTGNAVSTDGSNGKTSGGGKLATVVNGVQIVQLSVQGTNYYPYPIRVKKDIPVRLVADMNNVPGCSRSIIIPEFGVRKVVTADDNVIEFTPDKSGTFQFSCSMGMYRGQIIVEEADGSVAVFTGSVAVPTSGSCGGGGGCGGSCGGSSGGCGCGSR